MYLIKIILIFLVIPVCLCVNTLPVFVIDNERMLNNKYINNDPLSTISTKKFTEIIKHSVDHCDITLFFIEETFCREDHSVKDNLETPYYYLRQGILDNRVKYLPSVTTPYTTISKLFHPQPFNVFYVSSTDYKPQIQAHGVKYFYFYFKNESNNDTRPEVLRKHDFIINETCSMISEQTKKTVIAFYTGKVNPVKLEKTFTARSIRQEGGVFVQAPRARFFFRGVSNVDFRRSLDTDVLEVPVVVREVAKQSFLRTTIAYSDFQLSFNFILDPWYWTIDNIVWYRNQTVLGRTYLDHSVRWGRSLACSDPIVIRNMEDDDVLRISQYQLQPMQDDGDIEELPMPPEEPPAATDAPEESKPPSQQPFKFAKAEKCSGYISEGIMTCLLLSFFCLLLIIKASEMLMEVQSNDRFDDSRFQGLFNAAKE